MDRHTIQVTGMQCAGCENIIETELGTIDGTRSVDADYRAGVVEVTAAPGTVSELERTLEDLGYGVKA